MCIRVRRRRNGLEVCSSELIGASRDSLDDAKNLGGGLEMNGAQLIPQAQEVRKPPVFAHVLCVLPDPVCPVKAVKPL